MSASAVRRRLRNIFLAAGLGASLFLPTGLVLAPTVSAEVPPNSGGPACSRWTSTTTPPSYIWVYRNQSGRIDKVPFRQYVVTVLGHEWPGYLPHQLIA